jgi:cyanophycinase
MPIRLTVSLVLCFSAAFQCLQPPTEAAARARYDYYLTGNAADVTDAITTPGLMLMGGGTDVDAAFEWQIDRAGGGDFVVIRVSGADGYNQYVYDLGGLDSVETLVIKNRTAANDPTVVSTIENAEALFIAGGDQSDYVNLWKGTGVENAIHHLLANGVPIGGTSAGLAILGEFGFAALNGTITSQQALSNPFDRRLTLVHDFLEIPRLEGVITDSHFVERDRMGRLVAFLARIVQDDPALLPRGLGIDSQTAVLVDAAGAASVVGNGKAYFMQTPGPPETCQPKMPLTFQNLSVYRVDANGTFDFPSWTGSNGTAYQISADAGVLTTTPPGDGVY